MKDEKWDKRFLEIAVKISQWSNCIRDGRQVGAVIARDKRILTMGYNGAPAGIESCSERGYCLRKKQNIKSGTSLQMCYSVCAEQKAIIQAATNGISIDGATLYCTHKPCTICTRMIIGSGIARVVYINDYPDEFADSLIKETKIPFEKITF